MNKKMLGIVLAIIVIIGGAYYALSGVENKGTGTGEITITHKLSETPLMVPQKPQTAVVFDYGVLDIMDNFGLDVSGVAKASLPSYLSKYATEKYTDIGTLKEPNFETIAKMQPDVIFISGRQAEAYDELSKIAPTVYYEIDPSDYMASLTKNVTSIASIYGVDAKAEAALAKLEKQVITVQERVATLQNSSALITLTNDGKISAYGASSRFGIIHNTLNFAEVDASIETTTHGQQISYEYIIEKNPSFLFVIDRNKAIGEGQSGTDIFANDLMQDVQAAKDGHIIYLNQEVWYLASGGLTSTEMMVAEIAAVVA